MHISNATYVITFEVPKCIQNQHTTLFNTGGIADHGIIKYKYHILGGRADHNITRYHRLDNIPDHNIIKYHGLGGYIIKYHSLGSRADYNVTKYHNLGGRADHNVIKYHSLGSIADYIRI